MSLYDPHTPSASDALKMEGATTTWLQSLKKIHHEIEFFQQTRPALFAELTTSFSVLDVVFVSVYK